MKRLVTIVSIWALMVAPSLAADKNPLASYPGEPNQPLKVGDNVPVAHGGTGLSALTTHCVTIGAGTSAVHLVCPSSSGQFLKDNGASADPSFAAAPGGSPGGSSGQVQCNSSSTFAGIAATDTQLLIAQASGCPLGKTMSGDATISDLGALSLTLSVAHAWTGKLDLGGGGDLTPATTPAANAVGYLGVPINTQSASYTLVMADAGKVVRANSGSALTYTIPPHSSVAYPVGTTVTFRNAGAGALTITPGSGVTLLQAGSGTSASVTVQQYGFVTALQEASDAWVLTTPVPNIIYSAGVNTSKTYDPGVAYVALDSCTITVPASGVSRTFIVDGAFVFGGAGTHGQWATIALDGTNIPNTSATFTQAGGQTNVTAVVGPFPITVPGDNATHTIALQVTDAGATGNLVFGQRYVYARQTN